MKNTKLWINILWVLAGLLAVTRLATTGFSISSLGLPLIFAATAFALIHGAVRYGWRAILTLLAICLVVSNVLENLSISTGFPFGNYHYTGGLKLFQVPIFIGPAYFANAYLAWMLAIVLIGEVRRQAGWFTTVVVPLIASAFMVMWDLSFDPTSSTINHFWVWERGGGYFGVPITNYLGWFLTVYVFLQLFAIFLRYQTGTDEAAQPLPRSYYAQAIISYGVIGLTFVLSYLVFTGNAVVTDAAGVVWQTRSITEAEATISIFTMIFVSLLSGAKLLQAARGVTDSVEARREMAA
jgi:uncharacterized membrane protein